MKSRNTCSLVKGFTLIELLIAVAIFSVILGLGLIMSIDVYRGYSQRSERDVVVSLLQKARGMSLANIDQSRWGVCYAAPSYLIFKGSYTAGASTNEVFPVSAAVVLSGFPQCGLGSEIVFDQLTGKLVPQLSPATSETTITITQPGRPTQSVSVNNEGRINW